MALVFTILQKDFVLFAADRRHTRGEHSANYRSDYGTKIHEIMNGSALFGFAGHDLCEQIFYRIKDDSDPIKLDLSAFAYRLGDLAQEAFEREFAGSDRPSVEFLVAGFPEQNGVPATATTYWLRSPIFSPHRGQFPDRRFEVIGRSEHGALYALHRFGNRELSLDRAKRLAGFILGEIYECDTSVGGVPQIWVLRPGSRGELIEPKKVEALMRWAVKAGRRIEKMF
jgi:20S proteasome alpha/beta subunit